MRQHLIGDGPHLVDGGDFFEIVESLRERPPGYGRGEARAQPTLFDCGQPDDLPGQALLFPDATPEGERADDWRAFLAQPCEWREGWPDVLSEGLAAFVPLARSRFDPERESREARRARGLASTAWREIGDDPRRVAAAMLRAMRAHREPRTLNWLALDATAHAFTADALPNSWLAALVLLVERRRLAWRVENTDAELPGPMWFALLPPHLIHERAPAALRSADPFLTS